MISALILFAAAALLFRAWVRARRAGKPFLLALDPDIRQRRKMILSGTVIALSSLPVMLLAERLLPESKSLPAAIVTVYLILAALGLIAFFAKRQNQVSRAESDDAG